MVGGGRGGKGMVAERAHARACAAGASVSGGGDVHTVAASGPGGISVELRRSRAFQSAALAQMSHTTTTPGVEPGLARPR